MQTTYIMQVAPRFPLLQYPTKKAVTPSERWKLQKIYLCRLLNVSGLDDLTNIWRNIARLHKYKERATLKTVYQNKAQ